MIYISQHIGVLPWLTDLTICCLQEAAAAADTTRQEAATARATLSASEQLVSALKVGVSQKTCRPCASCYEARFLAPCCSGFLPCLVHQQCVWTIHGVHPLLSDCGVGAHNKTGGSAWFCRACPC